MKKITWPKINILEKLQQLYKLACRIYFWLFIMLVVVFIVVQYIWIGHQLSLLAGQNFSSDKKATTIDVAKFEAVLSVLNQRCLMCDMATTSRSNPFQTLEKSPIKAPGDKAAQP